MNPFNLTYANLPQVKVLIADDSSTDRLILHECASKAGFHQIKEAQDGTETMDMIMREKPDLLYLDMNMPGMNGLDICQKLFNANLHNEIVIIMQTASDHFQTRLEAFKLGITDYILKPINAREVISRTMAHIERRAYKQLLKQENHRINSEIREAGRMQRILLPSDREITKIREEQNLDLSYLYHPSSFLAGDYLTIRRLCETKTLILSIDVTGHGVTAALYTFAIHTLFQELIKQDLSPGELLGKVNKRLYALMDADKFATVFLGIIDNEQHCLHYAAAAAPQPIYIHNGKTSMLETREMMLGVQPDKKYETMSVPFESNDVLFVYSDALVETSITNESFLSDDFIKNFIDNYQEQPANDILQSASLKLFGDRLYNLRDDLTMIACKKTPAEKTQFVRPDVQKAV